MKNTIKVVGAIFINKNNEVFCARRPLDKNFGGLWEFPGGKVEKNESLEEAVKREIFEELNLKIKVNNIFMNITKEYENFIIDLTCLNCEILDFSTFKLKEHIEYSWIKKENLLTLDWVPTDIPIVEKLSI